MRTVPHSSRHPGLRLRAGLALGMLLGALMLLVLGGDDAPAQDFETQLDAKEAQLSEVREKKGVLTTEISGYTDRITQLEGEVATLRNREAAVEEQLAEVQAELDNAIAELERGKDRLEVLRGHLKRSLIGLREYLVTVYQSGTPDTVTVILESDGFDDLVERAEYLERIQEADENVVSRVRDLRDQTRALVDRLRATKERIEAVRDTIAAKERELERTRTSLQARQADLEAARGKRQAALDQIEAHEEELHGDVSALQAKIQQQLLAAQGITTLPAGPIQGGSGMFIWPVNGAVVSGFGMRWGRMHEGIDIAVPAGTPIRAAAGGSIALAGPNGGYGNYTCIDHGGGLSTCYAHQSAFAVTSGSVGQGDVIGYVGCTGHCFGDHLHFEVRVNGAATDPLAYL